MRHHLPAFAIIALTSASLHAATLNVTDTSDSPLDSASLRYALNHAQSGDTISLANNLGTINLTAPLPDITTALTINGGAGNTISGQNQFRIFFINAPMFTPVSITNLTLANGYAHGGNGGSGGGGGGGGAGLGGAIYLNGGALSLQSIAFSHNAAVGGNGGTATSGGFGGGGGGGGGTGNFPSSAEGLPGFGGFAAGNGGKGTGGGGGGGAALGAALFARPLITSLSLTNVSTDAGLLTQGLGGFGQSTGANGSAAGSALFLPGGKTLIYADPNTTQTIAGTISDSTASSLQIYGGGTLILSADNSAFAGYSGGNALFDNTTLSVSSDKNLGQLSSPIFFNNGTLQITGTSFTASNRPLTLNTGGGNIDIANPANALTLSQPIAGVGDLTKRGPGTLVLAPNNTYTGNTTIASGTLLSQNDTLSSPNIHINANATLQYTLSARTFQHPTTLTGNGTLAFNATAPGAQLVFGGQGTVNVNLSPGGLIDIQSGLLYASSSYGGNWTTNQASLHIAANAAVDLVEAGTTATAHIDALTGAGILSGGYPGNPNAGLSTLTLGIANGAGTFSGNIADDPAARLALIKAGAGTQTLSGNNAYTGGTTVAAGTLLLASSSALAPNTPLIIHPGATATESAPTPITLKLSALALAGTTDNWTSTLNLTSSSLIIEPTPLSKDAALAALQNQVAFGRTHPGGGGITSTDLPPNYALAVLDNAITNLTSFHNQTVKSNDLLLTPLLLGDTNADNKIDLTDLSTLLNHFGQQSPNWTDGNFDGASTINLTDLSDILNNFGLSTSNASQLPFTNPQLPATPTPEPTTLLLLLPTLAAAFARRTRERASLPRQIPSYAAFRW
ncbi:MAG: autotransporter-associated beta strand repeat-containing protein [Phycisphaerae bacterium]